MTSFVIQRNRSLPGVGSCMYPEVCVHAIQEPCFTALDPEHPTRNIHNAHPSLITN